MKNEQQEEKNMPKAKHFIWLNFPLAFLMCMFYHKVGCINLNNTVSGLMRTKNKRKI